MKRKMYFIIFIILVFIAFSNKKHSRNGPSIEPIHTPIDAFNHTNSPTNLPTEELSSSSYLESKTVLFQDEKTNMSLYNTSDELDKEVLNEILLHIRLSDDFLRSMQEVDCDKKLQINHTYAIKENFNYNDMKKCLLTYFSEEVIDKVLFYYRFVNTEGVIGMWGERRLGIADLISRGYLGTEQLFDGSINVYYEYVIDSNFFPQPNSIGYYNVSTLPSGDIIINDIYHQGNEIAYKLEKGEYSDLFYPDISTDIYFQEKLHIVNGYEVKLQFKVVDIWNGYYILRLLSKDNNLKTPNIDYFVLLQQTEDGQIYFNNEDERVNGILTEKDGEYYYDIIIE